MVNFEDKFLIKTFENVKRFSAKRIGQIDIERFSVKFIEQLSAEVTDNLFDRTHCMKQSTFYQVVWRLNILISFVKYSFLFPMLQKL